MPVEDSSNYKNQTTGTHQNSNLSQNIHIETSRELYAPYASNNQPVYFCLFSVNVRSIDRTLHACFLQLEYVSFFFLPLSLPLRPFLFHLLLSLSKMSDIVELKWFMDLHVAHAFLPPNFFRWIVVLLFNFYKILVDEQSWKHGFG